MTRHHNEKSWFCPLLGSMIAEGMCLDINYQRVDLFQSDVLTEVQRATKLDTSAISAICRRCPNQPLSEEDYRRLGVTM